MSHIEKVAAQYLEAGRTERLELARTLFLPGKQESINVWSSLVDKALVLTGEKPGSVLSFVIRELKDPRWVLYNDTFLSILKKNRDIREDFIARLNSDGVFKKEKSCDDLFRTFDVFNLEKIMMPECARGILENNAVSAEYIAKLSVERKKHLGPAVNGCGEYILEKMKKAKRPEDLEAAETFLRKYSYADMSLGERMTEKILSLNFISAQSIAAILLNRKMPDELRGKFLDGLMKNEHKISVKGEEYLLESIGRVANAASGDAQKWFIEFFLKRDLHDQFIRTLKPDVIRAHWGLVRDGIASKKSAFRWAVIYRGDIIAEKIGSPDGEKEARIFAVDASMLGRLVKYMVTSDTNADLGLFMKNTLAVINRSRSIHIDPRNCIEFLNRMKDYLEDDPADTKRIDLVKDYLYRVCRWMGNRQTVGYWCSEVQAEFDNMNKTFHSLVEFIVSRENEIGAATGFAGLISGEFNDEDDDGFDGRFSDMIL